VRRSRAAIRGRARRVHRDTEAAPMGANSTQGMAVLLFLVAFTFLAAAMFAGGSVLLLLLFVVALVASVALFLKAKPWEHAPQ
jgi:hypothetical protein